MVVDMVAPHLDQRVRRAARHLAAGALEPGRLAVLWVRGADTNAELPKAVLSVARSYGG